MDITVCNTSLTVRYIWQVSHLQLPLGLQLSQSALSHRPQLRLAAGLGATGDLCWGREGPSQSRGRPPPGPPPEASPPLC